MKKARDKLPKNSQHVSLAKVTRSRVTMEYAYRLPLVIDLLMALYES